MTRSLTNINTLNRAGLRTKPKAIALLAAMLMAAFATQRSEAGVDWQISVQLPASAVVTGQNWYPAYDAAPVPRVGAYSEPVNQIAFADTGASVPQTQYGVMPITPPAPVATQPSVEQIQAQQTARIHWGSRVGLLTPYEQQRLYQTAAYIEQQRRWAYADGWFTYDEQVSVYGLLNQQSQQIEQLLNNRHTAYQQASYIVAAPPVIQVWQPARPAVFGWHGNREDYRRDYRGEHHGHAGGHRDARPQPPAAIRVQSVQTPPVPTQTNQGGRPAVIGNNAPVNHVPGYGHRPEGR